MVVAPPQPAISTDNPISDGKAPTPASPGPPTEPTQEKQVTSGSATQAFDEGLKKKSGGSEIRPVQEIAPSPVEKKAPKNQHKIRNNWIDQTKASVKRRQ